MLGGVTHHMLPHLPRVPHLHINRPLVRTGVVYGHLQFTWENRKSNSLRYPVWEATERNLGCEFQRCKFSFFFFGLFNLGYTLQRVVLPPRQISKKFYVYAQGVCVDGKLPYI